jgi:hypothetical protein
MSASWKGNSGKWDSKNIPEPAVLWARERRSEQQRILASLDGKRAFAFIYLLSVNGVKTPAFRQAVFNPPLVLKKRMSYRKASHLQ